MSREGPPPMYLKLPLNSARLHMLRTPLASTNDLARANRSRFTWAAEEQAADDGRPITVYRLTPLGVLNALIGLRIVVGPTTRTIERRHP